MSDKETLARIQNDGKYFAIAQGYVSKKTGKTVYAPVQWYQTLEQAAIAFLNQQVAKNLHEPYDLSVVLEAIRSAQQQTKDAVLELTETALAGPIGHDLTEDIPAVG